jgi:glycosyltransferase involved in cell wall biosynthesis
MSVPQVSVIMPAYDAQAFIAEAIESIRIQDGVDLEIIVVDDGSTDGTRAIVERIAQQETRLRLLTSPHAGVAKARNLGLAAARGKVITFLDADDLYPPGRLVRQLKILAAASDTLMVMGEILIFRKLQDWAPAPGSPSRRIFGIKLDACLFRRELFDIVGAFDEQLEAAEDTDLLLRISEAGIKPKIDYEIAALYRRHAGNMTNDMDHVRRSIIVALHRSLTRRRVSGAVVALEGILWKRMAAEHDFVDKKMSARG